MTFIIVLALVAIALSLATVQAAHRDDRGPRRPPSSHFEDPQLLPPSVRRA